MIQVWKYNEQKVFVKSALVKEVAINMTTIPLLVGYIKPTFNEEIQEWFEGATEEEIKQWEEENKPVLEEDSTQVLRQEINNLKESQQVQDFLIDDIVFEVIPNLESQIAPTGKQNEVIALINKKLKGGNEGMAAYLAKKIIEGRDYRTVFRTNAYKQYQDEVDTILELEGRGDLIKR